MSHTYVETHNFSVYVYIVLGEENGILFFESGKRNEYLCF